MTIKEKRAVCKVKLKNILRDNIDYTPLFKAIKDANELITIGYLFMRSFFLYAIENKLDYPKINIDFVRMSFSTLIYDKKGGRPFNENKTKDLKMLNDYFQIFSEKTKIDKIVAKNISYILGQSYEQIYIAVINNIIYHFDKHIWRFIRVSFFNEYKTIREQKGLNKLKEYYSELEKVKSDIYNGTFNSPKRYHSWIKTNRGSIIPSSYSDKTFEGDVQKNTFSYIKCMQFMNKFIQESELKSYQIFPIRTGCYDHHIKINTSALIDLFSKEMSKNSNYQKNKLEYMYISGDMTFQKDLWNTIFSLKEYKRKDYSFNYEIETDGFAVSLNLINNNEIINKESKKENIRKKCRETAKNKKEMTEVEYNLFLENQQKERDKKNELQRQARKELLTKMKAEFKSKSKEEQEKIKDEINESAEFPYIEKILKSDAKKEEFNKLYEDGKLLFCDPGKRSPFYFMAPNNNFNNVSKSRITNFGVSKGGTHKINQNCKFMNYSNGTRLKFTKRMKYGKLVESWKKKNIREFDGEETNEWKQKSLKDLEGELANYNQKSCKHDEFIKYIIKKMEYMKKLKYQYDTVYLQKLQWFSYLNTLHHENLLINQIKNTFGDDIRMIIGDWSNNGRIRYISTPNIRLKRKFAEHFKVYSVDEFNTSKKHYKYHIDCDNMKADFIMDNDKMVSNNSDTKEMEIIQPMKESKRIHSVLTYKIVKSDMECNKTISGCVNRDKNSVLNMCTIYQHLIKTGKRHPIFDRKTNQINQEGNQKGKLSDARGAFSGISTTTKKGVLKKEPKSVSKKCAQKEKSLSEESTKKVKTKQIKLSAKIEKVV